MPVSRQRLWREVERGVAHHADAVSPVLTAAAIGSVAPDRGIVNNAATPPARCARRGCRRSASHVLQTAALWRSVGVNCDARRRGYAGGMIRAL